MNTSTQPFQPQQCWDF